MKNADIPTPFFAGFWLRFWAYLVDLSVIGALNGILPTNQLHFQILVFLLYFILMSKFTNGQTLGKMIFGLRVVAADKEQLDWLTILFREGVCRFIIRLLPMGNLTFLVIAFTTQKQGLPDMISDTYVVKEDYFILFRRKPEIKGEEPPQDTWLFQN
jgi:uncharacterized RDD family membrane protein YckC